MKISLIKVVVGVGLVVIGAIGVRWWLESNRIHELVIATGAETGEYYKLASAIATVVENRSHRLRVKVIATAGSRENLERLENGQVQLAIAQIDTPAPPSARSIASLYAEVFHLIVQKESKIKEVPSMKGKKFATPVQGSGSYPAFWRMMEHYGIRPNDMQITELTTAQAKTAFEKKEVEGFFQVIALNNQSMREFLQKTGAQLLPIDQAEAMKILSPYLEAGVIPRGTYQASPPIPDRDLPTVSVQAILYTHKDIDEGVIRELTMILFEHRSDLIALNPRSASISFPQVSNKNLGIPLHEGAQAYYDREKPSFLQENAEPIALIITVITIIVSLLLNLKSRFSEAQKNRADGYNLEIAILLEQIYSTDDKKELEKIRERLVNMFKRVIQDLDLDRLSPESYHLFVFPWEMAITALRHKEMILTEKEAASNINATILTTFAEVLATAHKEGS